MLGARPRHALSAHCVLSSPEPCKGAFHQSHLAESEAQRGQGLSPGHTTCREQDQGRTLGPLSPLGTRGASPSALVPSTQGAVRPPSRMPSPPPAWPTLSPPPAARAT